MDGHLGAGARSGSAAKVAAIRTEESVDAAGNQWFTLRGALRPAPCCIGGHIDSVPNGGWLDGALNVVAGVEVLRRLAEEGNAPVTVRLVNWADEEGARFGRSLFGSSAAAGSMADQDELRARKDVAGIALPDALGEHGVDLDRALDAARELEGAAAYLELHIEQGPVLEALEPSARRRAAARSASSGTRSPFAARRRTPARRRWTSAATHSPVRRGSSSRSARSRGERETAPVCTMGGVVTKPGIVTSVVETAECLLDQRHLDAGKLAAMLDDAKRASSGSPKKRTSRSNGSGSGTSSRSSSTTR